MRMKKIIEVCASAIIYYKNRFLVLYDHKYHHYVFVQGHQKRGESLKQTVLREAKEETGYLNFKCLKKLGKFQYSFRKGEVLITKVINCYLLLLINKEKGRVIKLAHEDFTTQLMHFQKANRLLKWNKDKQYLINSRNYLKNNEV
ncbi:MAG: NUDIX hydrolase [Candidatus Parcubacteria bacterium]|nr:NUDIX hydrolase [Candidatus Parcubacteria bacterium]